MNRLRTGGSARISFFSFQDIITSVTGILILVTLMLSISMQSGDVVEAAERRAEAELREELARATEVEGENRAIQQRRIEAAGLPDRAPVELQVKAIRREQAQEEERRRRSERELASARERAEVDARVEEAAANLRAEVAALDQQIEQLQARAARARTNVNAVFIIPDEETLRAGKKPVAVVVNGERVRAQRLDGSGGREAVIADAGALEGLLGQYDPGRDFIVFYFRPSGAKWFDAFRGAAKRAGFEVGYDAVEEQKQIIFAAP